MIRISNLTTLATYPCLSNQTQTFVGTVLDNYELNTASAQTVDGITIVTSVSGGRWIRMNQPSPTWMYQATWFIDPVSGNDENTGLTSGAQIKTVAELNRRWGVERTLGQSTTVTIASAPPSSDPLIVNVVVPSGSTLTFTGALSYVWPAGTVTSINGSNGVGTVTARASSVNAGNLTLSAPQTIDGVSVIAGDVVLAQNQTTASENGLYTVKAGAWTRTTTPIVSGLTVYVSEGQQRGTRIFVLVTVNPITVGSTSLVFQERAGVETTTNTFFGDLAGTATTSGTSNTAIGANALAANTTANSSTAIGNSALTAKTSGICTAIGSLCLDANTTGTANTAVGLNALGANVTNSSCTAVGDTALAASTADNCTAVGASALAVNTTGINSALGKSALALVTSGSANTAVGLNTLSTITTVSSNTAVGDNALAVSTAATCTAVGASALAINTSGINTCVGALALDANTTGTANTAMGLNALGTNVSSDNSTAVGDTALALSTSAANTAVGKSAGAAVSSGGNQTLVGHTAGATITAGTGNTCLGQAADVDAAGAVDRIAIGRGAVATIDSGLFFITGLATMGAVTTVQYDTTTGQMGPLVSSRRFKTDITELLIDSSKIYDLEPVSFVMKSDGSISFGFIAEDVEQVLPELVPLDQEGNPYSVNYMMLSVLLLAEMKVLRARIEVLEGK